MYLYEYENKEYIVYIQFILYICITQYTVFYFAKKIKSMFIQIYACIYLVFKPFTGFNKL